MRVKRQFNCSGLWWRVLAVAALGAALGSCGGCHQKAQGGPPPPPPTGDTTWTINVDVTSGVIAYSYTTQNGPSGASSCNGVSPQSTYPHGRPYPPDPNNPADLLLTICPTDTVHWVGNSSGNKHDMKITLDHKFFDDGSPTNPQPTTSFSSSNGNPTGGGKVDSGAQTDTSCKWSVVLVDHNGHDKKYQDDPKIIIGH